MASMISSTHLVSRTQYSLSFIPIPLVILSHFPLLVFSLPYFLFPNTGIPFGSQIGPIFRQGKKRLKEEADHFRLTSGSLISKGSYAPGFSWVGSKTSRSLHLPARILKVSIEALTGLRHVYCTDGLNNTLLSQGCILEHGSHRENCENIHPRTGEG